MDTKELQGSNPWGLTTPLHILVGNSNARKTTRSLICHICSEEFPRGSFIEGASGLSVSSPELVFIQMAEILSLEELVQLGFELCGGYRLGNRVDVLRGFRDDRPLTSVARLSAYLQSTPGIKGKTKARRALQFIADGAASPMETIVTMLLTLPYKLGGYGFSMPLLNYSVDVSLNTSRNARTRKYRCDLYWPERRVAIEYDSESYHVDSKQIAKDMIRRNALVSTGIKVVTVSKTQVSNRANLRELAFVLGKLLGKRMKFQTKKYFAHHAALHSLLWPKTPFGSMKE
jgi:very-short-patch-repair endonuclease